MSDMIDMFRDLKSYGQEERRANRRNALDHAKGWTRHTEYHWQRTINGKVLDYWPGTRRFRYDGKTRTGDVMAFIANLSGDAA